MAPPTTTTAFQKLFKDHKLKAEKTQFWWEDQQINGMCNNLTVNIFTMAHLQKRELFIWAISFEKVLTLQNYIPVHFEGGASLGWIMLKL